jgi:hypothetical protein
MVSIIKIIQQEVPKVTYESTHDDDKKYTVSMEST